MSFNEFLFQFPLESNASIFVSANSRGGGGGGGGGQRGQRNACALAGRAVQAARSVPRSERHLVVSPTPLRGIHKTV